MTGNSIFTVTKGRERVTLPNKQSAVDLMYALNLLDCYESITRQEIKGNREDLQLFEIDFLGKTIQVVGQGDCEKIVNWLFTYGCKKVSVQKLSKEDTDVSD